MTNNNFLIKNAPEELKNDQELFSEIIKRRPELFKFASKNLKNNKTYIMDLIKDNEFLLKKIFGFLW